MENKKIVTIQDASCYGQCSITVALPILSAFGYETAILPSAILSTHTSGFKDYVICDLSTRIPFIIEHWKKENIKFDVLYSAYLGNARHIDFVLKIKDELLEKGGLFILDPVMGDNGKIYPAFNDKYVKSMRRLVKEADIVIPNLTEATLLSGDEYKERYDESYIISIMKKLKNMGAKKVILTGISYSENSIGVAIYENEYQYYEHIKIPKSYHGTGDIYTSLFLGAYLKTNDLYFSAKYAANFVVEAIKNTLDDDSHWYGVKFEPLLLKYLGANKI